MNTSQPFNRVKECRHGTMIYNINDVYIGKSFDVYGEYSEGEVHLFKQLIPQGSVVMEIGANIGAHTLPLAKMVGPTGAVFAFEPQRVVFQNLCANMALNSIPNAYLFNVAVGESRASIVVPDMSPYAAQNFGGLPLGAHTEGQSIDVIVLNNLNIQVCRFIKVDVEGMELEVLKGASEVIKRCRPAIYVENDRTDRSNALIRYISSLNYTLYWHLPYLYNPNNFMQNPENIFPNVVSRNMICVPKETGNSLDGFTEVQLD